MERNNHFKPEQVNSGFKEKLLLYFIMSEPYNLIGRKHGKYFKDNELIHFIEADSFCEGN